MPAWRGYGSGNIKYEAAEATDTGRTNWSVTVDFSGDGEAGSIKTELAKIKGYGTYKDKDTDKNATDHLDGNKFKVTLWNGRIEKVETIEPEGGD